MTASEQLAQFAAGSKALPKLCREYKKESATVHLKELVGGALSFYAAAAVAKTGGVHIFVAEDRDAAAYLLNDFYNLLDEKQVYFFAFHPTTPLFTIIPAFFHFSIYIRLYIKKRRVSKYLS